MTELKPVFTVSELNEYVDLMLSRDPFMSELTVTGEISAFKRHTSGHLYFALKDDTASVRCVMFRPNALRLSFFPKDGMSVRIEGRAGLFGRDGSFQVYAERMEKTGDGALYQKFLALRDELKGRGWFDESLKKPIPFLPRAVGVVTSGTGAAIEDIRNVIARRFPNMPIVLYPVSVQGERAAGEIAAAIRRADQERRCDVLIVGRGGGSLEDLWAFNEEIVVAAVHDCSLPVISAVGHEIDFSLTDFAADLRAPTPSAAAELAVPDRAELAVRLAGIKARLGRRGREMIAAYGQELDRLSGHPAFRNPRDLIRKKQEKLDFLTQKLYNNKGLLLSGKAGALARRAELLDSLSPLRVLQRGYAAAFRADGGAPIQSAGQLAPGDRFLIRFRDGSARVLAEDVRPDGDS